MTRPPLLAAACALAALSLALPAAAQTRDQTREPPQLRRLDWAGRPAQDASGAALRRPAPVIPHAGVQPTRAALRPAQPWRPTAGQRDGRPSLTPADAFASPNPANAWMPPQPSARAEPPMVRQTTATPAVIQAQPPAAQPRVIRESRPEPTPAPPPEPPQARLVQPSPVQARPVEAAPPAPTPEAAADPMAPRRDAPIYRIQGARPPAAPPVQSAPAPVAQAAPPPPPSSAPPQQQGARYYSVHRQAGRTPDRTVLPEPVWLDRLPIEMDSTPSSEDLAAPPETPQTVRGADGRMRPVQAPQGDPIP